MQQSTLTEFESDGSTVPYEVPTPEDEPYPRAKHRDWYWDQHDKDSYECPRCGRHPDEVEQLHVHHIDEDPYNGAPENLIGMCRECHREEHRTVPNLSGLSVDEWKAEFENITESEYRWVS